MTQIHIKQLVPLSEYTTFKVGGPAREFVAVQSLDELQDTLQYANVHEIPVFVLAGGSNLIVSSKGFDGLVIKIDIVGCQVEGEKMKVGAATVVNQLVDTAITAGLAGLEWAGGLPGTLGGAIRGNAGAFSGEIKDSIESVKSVMIYGSKVITRDNAECKFGYRDSIFKQLKNEVIVEAILTLRSGNKEKLRAEANSHIDYRKQRHPLEYPNSGSIFKNTPVEQVPKKYLQLFQDSIKNDPFPVVPTAKIIALTDIAGLTCGRAQLSTKHTNFIVNLGGATGEDIFELIKLIRHLVYEKFGVELEVEPELIGF